MIISSYNKSGIGDVLVIMTQNSTSGEQGYEKKGSVVRIFNKDSGKTVGFNVFQISDLFEISHTGQVHLTKDQIISLNQLFQQSGFNDRLDEAGSASKFVVGEIIECEPHPDSDHLSVTRTKVDHEEVLQIVCGAPNISKGQKVVVARTGTIMPNGVVIWEGTLRGVSSNGMICSAKELGLKDALLQKGILILPETAKTGESFLLD